MTRRLASWASRARHLMALVFVLATQMQAVWALDAPLGPVLLALSGKIGSTNQPGQAGFDLALLQGLPQHGFSTRTPWDARPVKFSGPLLRDVLTAVKASGTTLVATAQNDYKITLPAADATRYDVILALKMNDQPIPPRTKGPVFLIYPFDSKPELSAEPYFSRSIWQLKSINVQ